MFIYNAFWMWPISSRWSADDLPKQGQWNHFSAMTFHIQFQNYPHGLLYNSCYTKRCGFAVCFGMCPTLASFIRCLVWNMDALVSDFWAIGLPIGFIYLLLFIQILVHCLSIMCLASFKRHYGHVGLSSPLWLVIMWQAIEQNWNCHKHSIAYPHMWAPSLLWIVGRMLVLFMTWFICIINGVSVKENYCSIFLNTDIFLSVQQLVKISEHSCVKCTEASWKMSFVNWVTKCTAYGLIPDWCQGYTRFQHRLNIDWLLP